MSKKPLKRGSEEWKKQQLERYLRASNIEVPEGEQTVDELIKMISLLTETRKSMEQREKENNN